MSKLFINNKEIVRVINSKTQYTWFLGKDGKIYKALTSDYQSENLRSLNSYMKQSDRFIAGTETLT